MLPVLNTEVTPPGASPICERTGPLYPRGDFQNGTYSTFLQSKVIWGNTPGWGGWTSLWVGDAGVKFIWEPWQVSSHLQPETGPIVYSTPPNPQILPPAPGGLPRVLEPPGFSSSASRLDSGHSPRSVWYLGTLRTPPSTPPLGRFLPYPPGISPSRQHLLGAVTPPGAGALGPLLAPSHPLPSPCSPR